MLNKLGIALYFLCWAAAIVVIFALVAGLSYLIAIEQQPFSWDIVSGSMFFIILAGIFWVCAQVAKHCLTDRSAAPPDRHPSP
ncbi:hypothetical protein [Billgrantia montanilacus]|uniref:Uncharacterized protein n=1 Tax=Billgrantia montanilacus TaxID=2282305 RepID=A0A368TPN3_9GAMM|nr:hypothetical protein [Halomonas montanilacus]RCV86528.1 hypothetical protein DU505_20190 [Halomonas montanilacus]